MKEAIRNIYTRITKKVGSYIFADHDSDQVKKLKVLLILLFIGFPVGFLLSNIYAFGWSLTYHNLSSESTEATNNYLRAQEQNKDDYRAGYKAGYALTTSSGKILTDGKNDGSTQYKMQTMGRIIEERKEIAEKLAAQHGGNKSETWKKGCEQGVIDGISGKRAKH